MKLNDNVENSVWKKLDQTQFNKKMTNIFVLKLAPTAKSLIARHFHLFCGQWNAITWISREKSHFVCPSVNFLKIKKIQKFEFFKFKFNWNGIKIKFYPRCNIPAKQLKKQLEWTLVTGNKFELESKWISTRKLVVWGVKTPAVAPQVLTMASQSRDCRVPASRRRSFYVQFPPFHLFSFSFLLKGKIAQRSLGLQWRCLVSETGNLRGWRPRDQWTQKLSKMVWKNGFHLRIFI